ASGRCITSYARSMSCGTPGRPGWWNTEHWCVTHRALLRNTTAACPTIKDQHLKTCRRDTASLELRERNPMHLKRQTCCGSFSKDHPGGRGLLLGLLLMLAAVSSALAWNKAGHMVSGAIAYAELKQASPQTLARVIALLKTHPHFETRWAP